MGFVGLPTLDTDMAREDITLILDRLGIIARVLLLLAGDINIFSRERNGLVEYQVSNEKSKA